jgi:hypothetical protein
VTLLALALQDPGTRQGPDPIVGWALIGAGVLDLLLAVWFGFVRPPSARGASSVFPQALGIGGIVLVAAGAAILLGAFA